MQKKLFVLFLAMALAAGTSTAWAKTKKAKPKPTPTPVEDTTESQSTSGIDQDITLEPLGFILGAGTLEYERMIDRKSSWTAGLKLGGATIGDWKYSAFGVEGSYRFFPLKKFKAPAGLWFGPAVEFVNYSWSYSDYGYTSSVSTLYMNLLAEAGWKFVWGSGGSAFVLSPYVGAGYSVGLGTTSIDNGYGVSETVPVGGATGFIGCSLGYGF